MQVMILHLLTFDDGKHWIGKIIVMSKKNSLLVSLWKLLYFFEYHL